MFNFKRNKKNNTTTISINKDLNPPEGWYVQQARQNPTFMLWDVALVSFDDICDNIPKPRFYTSTEKDTYQEALQDCINQIK